MSRPGATLINFTEAGMICRIRVPAAPAVTLLSCGPRRSSLSGAAKPRLLIEQRQIVCGNPVGAMMVRQPA